MISPEAVLTGIPHNCTHCESRHGCSFGSEYYLSDNCPMFVLGKCYRCKHSANEPEGICLAEDMSGYGCPNFAE